jgi:hypothetical protein
MEISKDVKHYKFINSETDHIIFYLSIPEEEQDPEKVLEATRQNLAAEKGIYVNNIYYSLSDDSDFDE